MSDFFYNGSELQMDTELILCIEEHDKLDNPKSIDNKIFIGWDINEKNYYVRGKRQDIGFRKFVPYAFNSDSTKSLYIFLSFVVSDSRPISVILYNYNNISNSDVTDLTYEFFESNAEKNKEISAYDNVKLNNCDIIKMLYMLKNMYNWQ